MWYLKKHLFKTILFDIVLKSAMIKNNYFLSNVSCLLMSFFRIIKNTVKAKLFVFKIAPLFYENL